MGKEAKPSEQRIVLEKVSWQKYETLLAEMAESRTVRFTYDRGRLEMMTPMNEHERCHKLIESLILVLADELKIHVEGYKAPTLNRPDLQVGIEPDTAYYIQHVEEMRHRASINLSSDPPPDLILEVALSGSAIDKLPLYSRLHIPEIWRYVSQAGEDFWKGTLTIYCMDENGYAEVRSGYAFPFLTRERIQLFIDQSDTMGLMSALRTLREWVQAET